MDDRHRRQRRWAPGDFGPGRGQHRGRRRAAGVPAWGLRTPVPAVAPGEFIDPAHHMQADGWTRNAPKQGDLWAATRVAGKGSQPLLFGAELKPHWDEPSR